MSHDQRKATFATGRSAGQKPKAAGLPLLRRPRPPQVKLANEQSIDHTSDQLTRLSHPTSDSFHTSAGSDQVSCAGDQQSQTTQRGADGLLAELVDLVGYSGDVEVRARYVPLGRKHAGPDGFPAGRTRHASPAAEIAANRLRQLEQRPDNRIYVSRTENDIMLPFEDAALLAHNTDVTLADEELSMPTRHRMSYDVMATRDENSDYDDDNAGNTPLADARLDAPVFSTQNYKRMPGWNGPIVFEDEQQTKVHALLVQAYDAEVIPRVPRHQLELEAAAKQLDALRIMGCGALAPSSHLSHAQVPNGGMPSAPQLTGRQQPRKVKMLSPTKAVFRDGESQHFCGQVRSRSPFEDQDRSSALSPAEAAVVQCGARSSKHLNLKAYFINEHGLPPLDLVKNVTYINLSFNCFQEFPLELYSLPRLQVLSVRDNPLRQLPNDLWRIATLQVLCVSYCMLMDIPASIFGKMKLRDLDVSYNMLKSLPANVGEMRTLQTLLVAGNQLMAMPLSADKLQLRDLRCNDNLFHPLFWVENEGNVPQRLAVLCKLAARQQDGCIVSTNTDENANRACHQCSEDLIDDGLTLIRAPRPRTHNVTRLPFRYHVCSTRCYRQLASSLQQSYTGE